MSMELFVFSDKRPDTIAEWNAALADIGFDVVIDAGRIADLRGSQPTKLREREVWIEYDHFHPGEFFQEQDYVKQERSWKYLLALRFGGDFHALAAAEMLAAAYAKVTEGVVLDEYEPVFRGWQEMAHRARTTEEQIPTLEASLTKATAELAKKLGDID
jgi:hypothetical protein